MLSLKATLKAIAESISTIKTALDGKATKYTGYGAPVTLTTSWYTIPSDGIVKAELNWGSTPRYVYITIKNSDGSTRDFYLSEDKDSAGSNNLVVPAFKGQSIKIKQTYGSAWSAIFIPFV